MKTVEAAGRRRLGRVEGVERRDRQGGDAGFIEHKVAAVNLEADAGD
ncbi:MAG: hypothetical protein LBI84_01005 [Propionibacteriaceae bacterium]|nr:hypothetical protein [Propionibacteriaceae bacterium]